MAVAALPVPRTVYRSRHGMVILNDKGAFAIRHAGIGEVAQVEQYYRLNKAQNFPPENTFFTLNTF